MAIFVDRTCLWLQEHGYNDRIMKHFDPLLHARDYVDERNLSNDRAV